MRETTKRILLLFFVSLGLLVLFLAAGTGQPGPHQEALPSSSTSAFPEMIAIDEVTHSQTIGGSVKTTLIGCWSYLTGPNANCPVGIKVNLSNQTFTVKTSTGYNLSILTLCISDKNGSAGINMLNPGTITITSKDVWDYSPIGYDTGDLYTGEYFQLQPAKPSSGLFGFPPNPFPPFPVITYDIFGFHISVPDFLAIPQWLGEIVIWAFNELVIIVAIGWEDVIGIPVKYIGEGITYVANLYDSAWNDVYNVLAPLPDGLGIFALPVASLVFGILLFATVAGFALIAEGIMKLVTL